jgi:hypothetical protein
MTTNQPVELGKVSEETKHNGPGPIDNFAGQTGEPLG